MLTLLILYLVSGILLVLLSIPLLLGKIPPNSFYGFRVAQTLKDPQTWYAANRYAAKWFIGAGLSIIFAAILLYQVPGLSVNAYSLGCLAVFTVVSTIGLVQSFRYIRRL